MEEGADLSEFKAEARFCGGEAVDLAAGVDNGGVITVTEKVPDGFELLVSVFAEEVHGDVAGVGNILVAAVAAQVLEGDVEVFAHGVEDGLRVRRAGGRRRGEGGEGFLGKGEGDVGAHQAGVGNDPVEGALEVAHIMAVALGQEVDNRIGHRELVVAGFRLEDGEAGFLVGGLDVGDEAPFQAGAEAVFEGGDLTGEAVSADDDLAGGSMEFVEGVEELLLGSLLASEELNIIDEEEVEGAVLAAKFVGAAGGDGVDELVGELFRGDVEEAVAVDASSAMTDGLKEVGLA